MSCEVALVCGPGESSAAVANALLGEFGDVQILVEQKEPRKIFLKRRLRRLGLITVAGQLIFTMTVRPLLRRLSRERIEDIVQANGLDLNRRPLEQATHVNSVNSGEAIEWLRRVKPKVVVVNGTRIIARRVLEAIDATFINTHCGITPEYRGSHGGYWALRKGDREHCGVTVHLVDSGIDTGDILAQQRIEPGSKDNFVTYPFLQLSAALPLLIQAVRSALEHRHQPRRRDGESGLWYHPTIWQYLGTGLTRGIW